MTSACQVFRIRRADLQAEVAKMVFNVKWVRRVRRSAGLVLAAAVTRFDSDVIASLGVNVVLGGNVAVPDDTGTTSIR